MNKAEPRPGAQDAPLLLPVPEAARLLGVGRTTLWAMTRSGQIASVRIGRRVLIPRAALEAIATAPAASL